MAALCQQMIRQIDLKNLSPHTRRAYLSAVTNIAKHYQGNQDIFLSDIPDLVFLTANVVPSANPISSINLLEITTLPRLLTEAFFVGADLVEARLVFISGAFPAFINALR